MKRLVALLTRKPGMSLVDFRAYYENNHAPLSFPTEEIYTAVRASLGSP